MKGGHNLSVYSGIFVIVVIILVIIYVFYKKVKLPEKYIL